MRRWNGWGDEATGYPLPESSARYLQQLVGKGVAPPDAGLESCLRAVPQATLPSHPLIDTSPLQRLLHARGQSLPDWIALRSGHLGAYPDGVAFPEDDEQIRALIAYAKNTGACLIPYGGGTSVVGHINPFRDGSPSLSLDLSRINQLLYLDPTSRLATFGAGTRGPELESQLARHGYTLGHFPQSFELSTLGGWIATRSSGQQSFFYGRIEDLFAGGHVETPLGSLNFPCLPASAAGPDLRQLFLGSEGRLGILTRATVRIRPLPEVDRFYGVFFPDWPSGCEAVRALAQEKVALSMLRFCNAVETETTLQLSGKERLVSLAHNGLRLLRYGPEPCLLVFGLTGSQSQTRAAYRQSVEILRKYHGLMAGTLIGKMWQKSRFLTPYLRNTLWDRGYAIDTLETALPWTAVPAAADAIQDSIIRAANRLGKPILVFAHLSHVYRDGASIYVTYLFPRSMDPEETLAGWQSMKSSGSQTVVDQGGTISHQHGVGVDHAPYLAAEKGKTGMIVLDSLVKTVDPQQMLNPGKLLSGAYSLSSPAPNDAGSLDVQTD